MKKEENIRLIKRVTQIQFYLLFVFSLQINAQLPVDPSTLSLRNVKKFGMNALRKGDTYVALDFFAFYCEKNPMDENALFQLSKLYLETRDYKNAARNFDVILKNKNNKFAEAQYYKAVILMQTGHYTEADNEFEKFIKNYKNREDRYYKRMAQVHSEGCKMAIRKMDSVSNISLIHLPRPVNHSHIDFAPIPISENEFYYSTLSLDSIQLYDVYDTTSFRPQRKLLAAKKNQDVWDVDTTQFDRFNNHGLHVSGIAFSLDKQRIYLSMCGLNWQNRITCSIYKSILNNDKWSDPEKIPYPVNDPTYTSMMPTVAFDVKTKSDILYFISDRKEGRGGYDIWYSRYNIKKNIWSEPRNAGGKINTIGNEITPFFDDRTHTMYFSSDAYPGFGGYDIYRSIGDMKNWTSIENMGSPINSGFDDLCFSITNRPDEGYFVSNRTGVFALKNPNCCDDIFQYKHNKYIQLGVTGKVFDMAESYIIEMLNQKFNLGLNVNTENQWADNIPVELYYIDKESKKKYLIHSDTTDVEGKYSFDVEPGKNYQVSVKNYGYFDKLVSFQTHDKTDSDTFELKKVGINYIPDKPLIFNVYFDFGKSNLSAEAKEAIDTTILELMNELPQIIIEVSTHTDSIGDDVTNLELSQKRAEAIVEYLIKEGIEQNRLIAKGYGESNPIAPNSNADGSDNTEGRSKNRRGEIKIVGTLEQFNKKNNDDE